MTDQGDQQQGEAQYAEDFHGIAGGRNEEKVRRGDSW
jgi:hypothetical protein